MRTLGRRTNVLLALAAAAGVALTLARPWYAAAPPAAEEATGIGDINGPLNSFFDGAQRWLTDPQGISGWEALDHWGIAIVAMAGIVALGGLLCLLAPMLVLGRDLLRYGAFAVLAITAWKLLDPPGANAAFELRNGALAAAGFALMLFTCGSSAASAPVRRKVVQRAYQAPPPPPAYGSAGPPNS